jgi:DNA repair exonuclease SbcCD ATPase subunit
VLEDNGGALTNAVGTALRLIAVVKAGVGRFLALDEADCWIAPDRVPAFYRVLADGARRLGVQCLAISHHDVSTFDAGLRVCRVEGEPATGVGIGVPDGGGDWDPDAPGLRFIRLRDVQGYADAMLSLSPGVNALMGPNNRGKSTVVRALRAVFYGEARDSLVRAGAGQAAVEIGLARGRTLRWTRQPRRTPVNLWSLHEADGSVVQEGGLRFESGGRVPPPWVDRLCGITKVEELDVHIAHQKFPVFLLGEPPSRRSAVLSVGQEAGYLRDMLALHRDRCRRDEALVRDGERELASLADELRGFEDLPAVAAAIEEAGSALAALAAAAARVERLEEVAGILGEARRRLAGARERAEATGELPDQEAFEDLRARVSGARERERAGERLLALRRDRRAADARLLALRDLPETLPALLSNAGAEAIADRLGALKAGIARQRALLERNGADRARIEAEVSALAERTGGLCPACGSPVEPATLLEDHAHRGRRAA